MIQKIGRKKFNIYAMDFETHADTELIEEFIKNPKNAETSVWLWYLINEKDKYDTNGVYGYDLDSFFNRMKELSKPDRKNHKPGNIMIYDYNLAFEWSFMNYYINEHGFEYKEDFSDNDVNVYNIITSPSMSNVWQIQLKLNKGDSIIVIRDLAKILGGGSLRKLAASYNLETQKGDIDFKINRRVENYIPTKEELIYCFKDVRIIMEILSNENTVNDKEFWKSISSASYSMLKAINFGFKDALKPRKAYRKIYPELGETESEFLRKGVGGGITYATPTFQYIEIKAGDTFKGEKVYGIFHIDLHQAHPSNMYCRELPYGKGIYYKFKSSAKLNVKAFINNKGELFPGQITCVRIKISYTSAKLHCCIPLIGEDFNVDREITVWDFEILTMLKCYVNLKIELIDCYIYKKRKLPFNEYYNNNYQLRKIAKKEDDKYHIQYYKLLNNSTFGKFLEHGHNTIFIPIVDEEGLPNTKKIETVKEVSERTVDSDNHVFIIDEEEYNTNGSYTYIPVGSAIPAYTRVVLIEQALKIGYQYIVYFDTDSIFFLDTDTTRITMKDLPLEDELCNWGMEDYIKRGQFACPKRYKIETEDNETVAKVAGFNIDKKEEYDDINIIKDERSIERAYRIKGGTLIAPQKKEINVDDKYKMIYDRNTGKIDYLK